MFSELVSDFIEAGRNFIFTFLHKKGQPKFVKPSALIKKYLFDFQDPQNKYSSRDTIPYRYLPIDRKASICYFMQDGRFRW
jgi:hypothetical protein